MKQTLIFLFVLLCLSVNSVFAQYDNYSLKDYVNPEYKRQALDFSLDGTLQNNSSKQNGSSPSFKHNQNNDYATINGSMSINYNRIKNSIRTQNTTYAGLSFGEQYYNNSYSSYFEHSNGTSSSRDYLKRNNAYNVQLNVDHNGYYYGNNEKFLLFAPSASFSYNHFKDKLDDETDESFDATNSTLSTYGSLSLGVGTGRIEEVGDARQAVYILQELQKQGVLKKNLSQEEINELAQLITKTKYKRRFDSRIRLIQEITSIDSLFVEKGYIEEEHSAAYFTTLYDNWMYAKAYRRSGNRVTLSVRPHFNYRNEKNEKVYINRDNYTINDTTKQFYYGADLNILYESEKPMNLYWQRSFSIGYSIGWIGSDYPKHDDSYDTDVFATYGIAYYPNSRTSISGSISENINYIFNDRNIWTTTSINLGMSYYFSPQLRLDAYYNLRFTYHYIDDRDNDLTTTYKDKYPSNSLSVRHTYSLF